MSLRQLSITDFTAHAATELLAVEQDNAVVALTRNGRIVAYVSPVPKPNGNTGTLADWRGTGVGFTLAEGASLDDVAWAAEEWEDSASGE